MHPKTKPLALVAFAGIALGYSLISRSNGPPVHWPPGATVPIAVRQTPIFPDDLAHAVRVAIADAQRYVSSQACQTCTNMGPVPQVTVVAVEPVEWEDMGLGCLDRGEAYERRRISGFAVILEAAGWQFEYHIDQSGNIVLCEVYRVPHWGTP